MDVPSLPNREIIINLNAVVYSVVVPFISIFNYFHCINFIQDRDRNSREKVKIGKKVYRIESKGDYSVSETRGKRRAIKELSKDSKENSAVL